MCVACSSPCKECENTVDQCTSCYLQEDAPYLYGHKCLEECPSGYAPSLSDGSTCELVVEDVVPFVFLLLAVAVMLAIGIAKAFNKAIHYKNTMIGIVTVVCLSNWVFLLYLTVRDNHWQSSVILMYGLAASYILNLIFFLLYWKVMRHDEYYNHWRESRTTRETILVVCALLTSF